MRVVLNLLVLVIFAAAAIPAAAQPEPVHVPVPEGWTAVDEEYRYGRDNVWEYINGAAEQFLSYGFRELVVLDVEQGESALTISVYDMGRPLDAFGIFETESPASGDRVDGVGAAAILQPPYRALMLKDRFYVKLEVGGEDVSARQLKQAMVNIAQSLPGKDGLPAQLEALPEQDRVPGTVSFAGSNFLGFGDLSNCLHADYKQDDDLEYRLFVMAPSKTFLKGIDKKWTRSEGKPDSLLLWREIPYEGVVVLMGDEKQLLGVAGFEDFKTASALLESLQP